MISTHQVVAAALCCLVYARPYVHTGYPGAQSTRKWLKYKVDVYTAQSERNVAASAPWGNGASVLAIGNRHCRTSLIFI